LERLTSEGYFCPSFVGDHWSEKSLASLEKLRVMYVDLTLLNPNTVTKMLYHAPLLREKGSDLKSTF
jgi:hypothetical protein